MPADIAAEVLFRFLFELVVYTVGYATGWLLIPTLSFGYYSVEPLSPPRRGQKRARSRTARPPRELSFETTATIGAAFWFVVIGAGIAIWWFSKPLPAA